MKPSNKSSALAAVACLCLTAAALLNAGARPASPSFGAELALPLTPLLRCPFVFEDGASVPFSSERCRQRIRKELLCPAQRLLHAFWRNGVAFVGEPALHCANRPDWR